MSKSIIEEIFLDNQSLCEKIERSREYRKAADEAYSYYDKLHKCLNDEQKKSLG